ncbi:tetratricopeptide repeat protein [Micromonospora sp. NBC_00362]|uniref:tetratricopeptide repeat protein n=1 Tax=Micromonospora sp. NBC_00362 TaxID=2975975 RepID=UPI00225343C1|nr:tetratricopeptide repeat protein [Micromonospora sp. NBC_00362]MCX5122031.1 tetratricopeptide repeat protein [Micromonospora sp. NBC_00362]
MNRDRSDVPTPAGYTLSNTGDAWADAPGSIAISGFVDGDVTLGLPRYRLTALAGGTPRPAETLRLAELLDARHRVVPFLGRDEEQQSLGEWLTAIRDRPDRAVQLIHAPGGQGKTRLADQFADTARKAGWEVLRAYLDPGEPDRVATGDQRRATAGLLVLVDYGDWWPASDLRALFTDPRLHREGPVRVLVLARAVGYWWQALRHWLRATLGMAVDEFELAPLAPDADTRERLFRTATARFAALVSHARIDAVRVPDLADPAYGSALSLQLAALVAVAVSHDRTLRVPSTLVDMYGYLLDREVGHWRQSLAGDAVTSGVEQLDRVVLVAMLAGPVPYHVGQAVVGCAGVGSEPGRVAQLLGDHSTCYPPRNAGWVLEPLQPDRLGEAYLALAIPGHRWSSYAPKPWAVGVVRALLRGAGMPTAQAARVRAGALTVLAEVAAGWPHVAAAVLLPALRDDPALATAAGGAVLAKIIDLPDVDVELLARIEPFLPPGRHVDFDNVAREVVARLAADRLARDPDPVERARLHIAYGRRLANAGDREAALEQTDLAVAAGEAAVAAASPETSALLALALHLRAHRLAAVNRYPAALASAERAVELLTPLAEGPGDDAGSFRWALAEALDNLALRLSHVQLHEKAEVAGRQAVELFTGGSRSARGERGLAGALANLAVIEAHRGRREEALATVRRAERIWRRLSDDEPSVYRPELALTLNTVSLRHAELGQLSAAVAAAEESVGIFRDLVRANAVAFELDLAAVLANLSGYLWQLDRRTEAFQYNAEAEEIFGRWGGANPQAFSLHLRHLRENIAAMRAKQFPVDLRRWELGAQSFNS